MFLYGSKKSVSRRILVDENFICKLGTFLTLCSARILESKSTSPCHWFGSIGPHVEQLLKAPGEVVDLKSCWVASARRDCHLQFFACYACTLVLLH